MDVLFSLVFSQMSCVIRILVGTAKEDVAIVKAQEDKSVWNAIMSLKPCFRFDDP